MAYNIDSTNWRTRPESHESSLHPLCGNNTDCRLKKRPRRLNFQVHCGFCQRFSLAMMVTVQIQRRMAAYFVMLIHVNSGPRMPNRNNINMKSFWRLNDCNLPIFSMYISVVFNKSSIASTHINWNRVEPCILWLRYRLCQDDVSSTKLEFRLSCTDCVSDIYSTIHLNIQYKMRVKFGTSNCR